MPHEAGDHYHGLICIVEKFKGDRVIISSDMLYTHSVFAPFLGDTSSYYEQVPDRGANVYITTYRYFVSILVEDDNKPLPVINKIVGLDLGIKSMVALSTGESVGNPRYFAEDEKKLAKAQRQHARKKKGSRNRSKARLKVAKIHARIADRRRDYQHELSTRIVHENQVMCEWR